MRSRIIDVALMAAVLIAEIVAIQLAPWPGWVRSFDLLAAVLIAIGVGALWWRRTNPIAVTAVTCVAVIVWDSLQYVGGTRLAVVVALFAVGLYEENRRRSQLVGAAVSVLGALLTLLGGALDRDISIGDPIAALLLPAVIWFTADRGTHSAGGR